MSISKRKRVFTNKKFFASWHLTIFSWIFFLWHCSSIFCGVWDRSKSSKHLKGKSSVWKFHSGLLSWSYLERWQHCCFVLCVCVCVCVWKGWISLAAWQITNIQSLSLPTKETKCSGLTKQSEDLLSVQCIFSLCE